MSRHTSDRTERVVALALEHASREATLAICGAAWEGSVSPVVPAPFELECGELLAALSSPVKPPGRGTWDALRAGQLLGDRNVAERSDRSEARRALRGVSLLHDDDLDRAAAIVVRQAFLAALTRTLDDRAADGLGPSAALAPATIRRLVESLPQPPRHPGGDHRLRRELESLARATPSARSRERAIQLEGDHREALAVARSWLARLDTLYGMLASIADPEGRAIVRAVRAISLVEAGWDPEIASTMDPRPLGDDGVAPATGVMQPVDRVLREVRDARLRGFACAELATLLLAIRPIACEVAESVSLDAEGRLRASTKVARLTAESLDAWRRACGLRPTPRGWESAAPAVPPSRRKRDAPFGIKPLAGIHALGSMHALGIVESIGADPKTSSARGRLLPETS